MENITKIITFPENDIEIINFITKKGTKNILFIGLNPKEDNNLKLLDELAYENGFDGWVLTFLYPKIKNNVSFLELEKDEKIFWKNISLIDLLIIKNQFNIDKIALIWGNQIESFNQTYLKESAFYIHRKLEKHNLKYVCVGKDKNKNPQSITKSIKFKNFDFKGYASHLQKTVKIIPEITLNSYGYK